VSNSELESAIRVAFELVGQSSPTEARFASVMAHLRYLLDEQLRRAREGVCP
jgi:hypothetical protein